MLQGSPVSVSHPLCQIPSGCFEQPAPNADPRRTPTATSARRENWPLLTTNFSSFTSIKDPPCHCCTSGAAGFWPFSEGCHQHRWKSWWSSKHLCKAPDGRGEETSHFVGFSLFYFWFSLLKHLQLHSRTWCCLFPSEISIFKELMPSTDVGVMAFTAPNLTPKAHGAAPGAQMLLEGLHRLQ